MAKIVFGVSEIPREGRKRLRNLATHLGLDAEIENSWLKETRLVLEGDGDVLKKFYEALYNSEVVEREGNLLFGTMNETKTPLMTMISVIETEGVRVTVKSED